MWPMLVPALVVGPDVRVEAAMSSMTRLTAPASPSATTISLRSTRRLRRR
jgi:hypothetical protein